MTSLLAPVVPLFGPIGAGALAGRLRVPGNGAADALSRSTVSLAPPAFLFGGAAGRDRRRAW